MGIDVYELFGGAEQLPLTIADALRAIQALPVSATTKRRTLRAWADATGRVPTPADYLSLTSAPGALARRDGYA